MSKNTPLFLFASLLLAQLAGLGEWKKHVVVQGKGSMNVAVASDFDKDGHVDVMTSFGGGATVFRGPDWKKSRQVTRFSEADQGKRKLGSGCIHGCLLDVDGDGDQDFVGSNQMVFWLECPDEPFDQDWTFRVIDDEILGTHCLITGDVDRDGKLDLVANSGRTENTSFPHSIVWLQAPANPRSGAPWTRHVFADKDAPGGSHYMGLGDVNGDGLPDIACGAKGGEKFPGGEWFAWWEQPKGGKTPWKKHLLSDKQPGASNILPADLNGDGSIDYFASRGHAKGALWFKGPDLKPVEIDPTIDRPHSLALADIDKDGDMDAATCGSLVNGEAVWYENDGKGKFTRHLLGKNQGSYDLRTVDMDGDNDLDVLIAGHSSSNLVWFENPLANSPKPFPGKQSSWKGFAMNEFTLGNRSCRVVRPKKPAPGRPWIWRARFWGHEPQTDLALLEKGWHVTYSDIGNLFGAPQAVALWDNFHEKMINEHGLAKKVALEGMSRGGLIIYNWAKKNPEKTLCIYGDAPVLDFKSWPGGKGKGKGSKGTWEKCLQVYGLTENEAKTFRGLPLYGLESLAKQKVPLFHVVGQADTVVPVEENTDLLEKSYKSLGGLIQVIRKEGIGHHPHSLKDPEPIVSFVLEAWKSRGGKK
jgi:pimeloyl-ACP methyl ester carboxylesterase